MPPVEVQHVPSGTENGPQGTKRVQPSKTYGCSAFFLRDLAEIDGGEGGIRIYSRSQILNDLNDSGATEAIETTEFLDRRT
jgi:hypothetical protein